MIQKSILCDNDLIIKPGRHIQDEEVPVLESLVQHRFPVFRQVVFVEGPEAFEVPSQEQNGFFGQLPGLIVIAVVDQSPENQIINIDPDRAQPG